jgi:hypothetical protein
MDFRELLEGVCEANDWTSSSGEVVVSTERGRTQSFRWKTFADGDREMVRIWTIVGPAAGLTEIRQRAALALNFSLPVGAFAVADESLCMTATFAVGRTDEHEVEHALRALAEVADRYERQIFGGDAH